MRTERPWTALNDSVRTDPDLRKRNFRRSAHYGVLGGRGLILIARLSSACGVQRYLDHKTVWAELALEGAGTSGHVRHLAAAPSARQSS